MPEICDNGIDDDMDGLIDLNDTLDCECDGLFKKVFRTSTIIPNHSFEDTVCCPTGTAQLTCAKDWIQASRATSDFYHTCGFEFSDRRGEPPQPLPSGEGYVGVLDISADWDNQKIWKEYVGACLTQPFKLREKYTLQFFVGFGHLGTEYRAGSSVTMALYGTSNCRNLPFGGSEASHCPTIEDRAWFKIAEVTVRGFREWVVAEMKFTSRRRTEAIAIGPSCEEQPLDDDFYYYIDELTLNDSEEFVIPNLYVSGTFCNSDLVLSANHLSNIHYQWYRNGIAITGANGYDLTIAKQDTGIYQLMVSEGGKCQLSLPFDYFPQNYFALADTTICEGDTLLIDGIEITKPRIDTFQFQGNFHCDSTVVLRVHQLDTSVVVKDTLVCRFQDVVIGGDTLDNSGIHLIYFSRKNGCDSTVQLNVRYQDTVFQSMFHSICAGDSIVIRDKVYKQAGEFKQYYSTDTICELELTINIDLIEPEFTEVDSMICEGQPGWISGPPIFQDTSVRWHLMSWNGCDSFVTQHFEVLRESFSNVDTMICIGDPILLHGEIITSGGEYSYVLNDNFGCDSHVTYYVSEKYPHHKIWDTAFCRGGEVIVFNDIIKEEGSYLISKYGSDCDSTVELTIDVVDPPKIVKSSRSPACHNDKDGWLLVQLESNDEYYISWHDNSDKWERNNLNAGIYYFHLISPIADCIFMDSIVIGNPDSLFWDYRVQHIRCDESNSGRVDIEQFGGGTGELMITLDGENIDPPNYNLTGLSGGYKYLRMSDQNGCFLDDTLVIDQIIPGQLDIIVSEYEVVLGDSVYVEIEYFDIDSFLNLTLVGNDVICEDYCEKWVIRPPLGSSTYRLYAKDKYGCEYELQFILKATRKYFVPNSFTPNGDRINDFFTLFDNGSIREIKLMEVYDRWGELVFIKENFSSSTVGEGWDGYFNGKPLNPGVFAYRIQVIDKQNLLIELSGDVTLLR